MDKKDVTISWSIFEGYGLNSSFASAADSPFHRILADKLGVTIDWQFVPVGGDGNQLYNVMLASSDMTDVVFKGGVIKDASMLIEDGIFRDLTPYIREYSPAYYAWLQTDTAYDKTMKTDLGQYFGYGFFREAGGWNDTYLGPLVRKDWLDAQNLPMPKTISDWDATLVAFKENYDAVFSFAMSRFESTGISGAFGAYGAFNYSTYIDNNNKVQLSNAQPEWRDYMAKLNEWWSKGLLDQDFLTTDDTMARSNALNGKMGLSVSSMGQLSNWDNDAEEAGQGANWMGLQYPTGDDGTLSMVFGGNGIGTVAAYISTKVGDDKLETVMRAMDYAYTDEGNLYWNFGEQGLSWDYDADGNPMYLPIVTEDPDGLNNAIDKYGGSTWSGNCIQATILLYLKNKPKAVEANDLWFYPNIDVTQKWLPNGLSLSVDDSNTIADIRSAMDTYSRENAVKYVIGDESLDNFDSFVSQLENMRLTELLAIYQDAYDNYLAR
jgi:putative aldouronate transport system substrate-binding protein